MPCIEHPASEHDNHKLHFKLGSDAKVNPGLQWIQTIPWQTEWTELINFRLGAGRVLPSPASLDFPYLLHHLCPASA